MKLACMLVRRSAAAYTNNELRNGRLDRFVRNHLETCPDCAREVEAFRAVGRLLASTRPADVSPRVQWDDVRRTILARREAQRQRAAAVATMRRGASLAVVCGAAALALWFVGPTLRNGLISGTPGEGEIVKSPEPQPAPTAITHTKALSPSVQEVRQPQLAEASMRQGQARSITAPVRTERVALVEDPKIPAPIGPASEGPTQIIAVELSPNANTGAVEAAVVSPDEGSLFIDT